MNLIWFIIRGSGIAAFALLATSTIWGLLVSTKTLGRAVKPKGLTGLHEALGIGAVIAVIVHVVAVRMDDYIGFTWADALVPGMSEWEPVAVALGVVSFWMMLVVVGSFYAKKWLGPVVWKVAHRMSLGVFIAALVHGVLAGTDSTNPWVVGMYAGAVAAVVMLTIVRILATRQARERPRPRARAPESAEV